MTQIKLRRHKDQVMEDWDDSAKKVAQESSRPNAWVFRIVGVFGNALFFLGSIGFLFHDAHTFATWLFILGSCLALVSSLASMVEEYRKTHQSK